MTEVKEQISKLMASVRKKRLPSSEQIVEETFQKLGIIPGKIPPDFVQQNFNQILNDVWIETLHVLEEYEGRIYPSNTIDSLMTQKNNVVVKAEEISKKEGFKPAVRFLFTALYPYLREIFLSISQSRKQRGGKDFEFQFGKLLQLIGIPYQRVQRKFRVDFMIPSDDAFKKNPISAVIVSAKRTLRERWREVVEELHAMRSPNIFLATADYDVSKGHIKAICDHYRIHLIVWDEVKEKYSSNPLVLGYTEWSNERIPILKRFWK
jgi:hypothetical protein